MTFRKLVLTSLLIVVTASAAAQTFDATVIIGGDIHIGDPRGPITDQIAENHVVALNKLLVGGSRAKWPAGTTDAGKDIPEPQAVFIAGDLMRDGSANKHTENVKKLRELYIDSTRKLKAHAFLSYGNHDVSSAHGWYTIEANKNNNAINNLIWETSKPARFSAFETNWRPGEYSSPPHYSVRLGGVLFVVLSGSIGEPCRKIEGLGASHGFFAPPHDSVCDAHAWLRKTLADYVVAASNKKAPIVIIQHYGYDKNGVEMDLQPWRGYRWTPEARQDLSNIISGYNVVALVHAHTHTMGKDSGTVDDQPGFAEGAEAKLDVGYPAGRGWADVDGNGKLDYCRIVDGKGGQIARCTLFDGAKFGGDLESEKIDAGYDDGRAWVDIDADGKADFCRVIDKNGGNGRLRCEKSNGKSFSETVTSHWLDVGYVQGRAWVDVNGDKKADYCRVFRSNSGEGSIACAISNGFGFTGTPEKKLDVGWADTRVWADADDDKLLDYCRLVSGSMLRSVARCTLFKNGAFSATDVSSAYLDNGDSYGRTFVDVNNDRKADFCRITNQVTAVSPLAIMRCTLSNGSSFATELTSSHELYETPKGNLVASGIDIGFAHGRAWVDFDGSKSRGYCRVIEQDSGSKGRLACSYSGGVTLASDRIDPGYAAGRTWADVDGDGSADYCRIMDSNSGTGRVGCVMSRKKATTLPVDSFSVGSGYCDEWGGFTLFRITDTKFEAVEISKEPSKCAKAGYDGTVIVSSTPFVKTIVTK